MNVTEFSYRCNMTPQVVRGWLRDGLLKKYGEGVVPADGYSLVPRVVIRRGSGARSVSVHDEGVTERAVRYWRETGRVTREGDTLYIGRRGMCFETTYKPVRMEECHEGE